MCAKAEETTRRLSAVNPNVVPTPEVHIHLPCQRHSERRHAGSTACGANTCVLDVDHFYRYTSAVATRQYWLMKTEPDVFSIHDLRRKGRSPWDGVRNYTARNFMKDEMKMGDLVLFYHSSVTPPGVAGIARVCSATYPDPTQFDTKSQYYDPKSKADAPRWWLIDVEFVEELPTFLPLPLLRESPEIRDMVLLRKGMRLSVQPVSKAHFSWIVKAGKGKTKP
jgi:predicted RNA-binding protein with PUA-like domain